MNIFSAIRELKDSGIPEAQAQAIVSVCASSREDAATRQDVEKSAALLKSDLDTSIASVRTELGTSIASVRTELGNSIAAVKTDVDTTATAIRSEMAAMRAELKGDIALLGANMDVKFERLQKNLMYAAVAVMFTFIGGAISIIARLPISIGH